MSNTESNKNVLESVSAISYMYYKSDNAGDMFSEAFKSNFAADHTSKRPIDSTSVMDNKSRMKEKFIEWGIKLKWVVLFPHLDGFNG
jgi:hypothetical protein